MLFQPPLPPKYAALGEDELCDAIRERKAALGSRLVILGHHYQQDSVIQFADVTGDSLKLAQVGSRRKEAEFIVFCGVHFMAESADILTDDGVRVILPDLSAGCSMADMADIDQLEEAWSFLVDDCGVTPVPITYVNSTLHERQCPGDSRVGIQAGRQGHLPAGSTPRAQHGLRDGHPA